MVELYGQNGPIAMGTKFAGLNTTAAQLTRLPGSPGLPVSQTAAATGANLPSPMTWLVGAIVLLILLKTIGDSDKFPMVNPAHIHIGGYNVLTIFVIVLLSVVGMKIVVNRPFFERGPQAGFASLVNAT